MCAIAWRSRRRCNERYSWAGKIEDGLREVKISKTAARVLASGDLAFCSLSPHPSLHRLGRGYPSGRVRRTATMPQPNHAKRSECVQLAGAVVWPGALGEREQAPRSPNASRGRSPIRTFAACELTGV